MACLGVHFALSDEDMATLRAFADDEERLNHLKEKIEEKYLGEDSEYAAESDKSWDAMHRLLSDGYFTWDGGQYPLNHAVLAGESLYTGDDYIMSLKTAAQVAEISAALDAIAESEFRQRYERIPAEDYGEEFKGEEDFLYTWEWFQGVRTLYRRAAAEGRHVLFTVDQ